MRLLRSIVGEGHVGKGEQRSGNVGDGRRGGGAFGLRDLVGARGVWRARSVRFGDCGGEGRFIERPVHYHAPGAQGAAELGGRGFFDRKGSRVELPVEDLCRRPLAYHAPRFHHDHLVGAGGLVHEVGDAHHGGAGVGEAAAEGDKFGAPFGVEHRRRLVEHEDVGAHGQGACDRHALLLPARKLVDLPPLETGKPHGGERLSHALAHLVFRHAHVAGAEGHVVFHQGRYELVFGILEDERHLLPNRLEGGRRGYLAFDCHRAGIGEQQGVEMAGERALAAAVSAHHAGVGTARRGEGGPVEGRMGTVVGKPHIGNSDHAEPWPFSWYLAV